MFAIESVGLVMDLWGKGPKEEREVEDDSEVSSFEDRLNNVIINQD